jgi:hypothetical protein
MSLRREPRAPGMYFLKELPREIRAQSDYDSRGAKDLGPTQSRFAGSGEVFQ